ncbi:MAG: spore germination protein GerW family protein [Acidimicrobiia bacterium]
MELERISHVIEQARDALTVRRVYGDPIERDGTVVIPAAAVAGGAGGGGGTDELGNVGGGSGFGLHARPVGAFVIRDGNVRWEPVIDRERQLVINAALAIGMLLVLRPLLRGRRRGRGRS